MEAEEWRLVADAPGYEISSFGRVRSFRSRNGRGPLKTEAHLISPGIAGHGHQHVSLYAGDGTKRIRGVHVLVAEAFLAPKPFPGAMCRHLDDDPGNNKPENLAWGTQADNVRDRVEHGRSACGERTRMNKLSSGEVGEIKARLAAGETGTSLAREFGVAQSTISWINTGVTWKHVKIGDAA